MRNEKKRRFIRELRFLMIFCLIELIVFQVSAAIKKESTLSIKELLDLPRPRQIERTLKTKEASYNDLIKLAFDKNEKYTVRWKALVLASSLKKEDSLKDLEKALKSSEWFMKNAALVALAEFNYLKAKKEAIRLLSDKALVVRSAAVDVLSRDLDSKTRAELWKEIDKPYNFRKKDGLWIRGQILSQLSLKPENEELNSFTKYLTEKDARLFQPAIAGLKKITDLKLVKKEEWLNWMQSKNSLSKDLNTNQNSKQSGIQ